MKDSKWKDNPIGSKNEHGNPKKKRPPMGNLLLQTLDVALRDELKNKDKTEKKKRFCFEGHVSSKSSEKLRNQRNRDHSLLQSHQH